MKENEQLTNTHGTSYYIAPEVLNKKYNERCDVWSIGVMLYILLSGKPPFDGANDIEITENVKTGQFQMKDKIWKPISEDAKDLIKKMLKFDATQRVSARQALQHKWFDNAPDVAVDIDLMKESLANLLSFNAVQKM